MRPVVLYNNPKIGKTHKAVLENRLKIVHFIPYNPGLKYGAPYCPLQTCKKIGKILKVVLKKRPKP